MQQQESSLTSIPINQLAMLRLNSAAVNHHSTTTTTTTSSTVVTPEKTTVHGGTTNTTSKRSFCPFSSTLQEPFPKRAATLDHKTDQETPAKKMLPPPLYRTYSDPSGGSSSSSRNDIITPSPSPSPAKKPPLPPPLYRTISDPTGGSTRNEIITPSPTATSMRLKRMKKGMREMSQWCNHMIHQEDAAVSQENNNFKEENERETPPACDCEEAVWVDHVEGFMKLPLSQETPAKKMLPPPPPPLKRTYSDPTGGAASTSYTRNSPQEITPSPSPSRAKKPPLPPPLSRTLSDPTQLQESPTATNMRLKRMKEGMREMSQWCSHLIHQEEDAATASQENDNFKEENERETLSACDCEEAVWVERRGECLVLHFKCPCGKGYEILLLGNKCYYMLD